MIPRILVLAGLTAMSLSACRDADVAEAVRDPFSYANTDDFTTRHLALDLDVDFSEKRLRGTATLHLDALGDVDTLVLDTRDLDIRAVRAALGDEEPTPVDFRLLPGEPGLGQPLQIHLPMDYARDARLRVEIDYATDPGATALQWLPPRLTAGGEHPFLFSQSQAIHARSWVPLQDTPSVRFTYGAVVRTPPELLALMSAVNEPDTPRDGEYRFEMPQPIPSYLLAIAVGNVHFAPIGEDTGVYAEPELLDAAAREFDSTQAMLEAAEARYGPYQWGRYDLLILPPSFPYGGMENPRLSFITPSVIAGDRSLVSLIAHELAHSWSGNLVTNATWRDIWLNEGITSYLDSRLMEALYGRGRANEERVLQWASLQEKLEVVPEHLQPLAPDIRPADGEFGQQGMQYAKGQFFLEQLERQFGRATFDAFLASYFDRFEWRSITTGQFLDYLDEELLRAYPGRYTRQRAEEWLYQPGIPEEFEPPESATLEEAERLAKAFSDGEIGAADIPAERWSAQTTVRFINTLSPELDTERMAALDRNLGLSASRNAEIARAWFIQVARREFRPAYPAMRDYLSYHGRMRLVTPVYKALASGDEGRSLAREIFEEARTGYHPITVMSVERALAAAPH